MGFLKNLHTQPLATQKNFEKKSTHTCYRKLSNSNLHICHVTICQLILPRKCFRSLICIHVKFHNPFPEEMYCHETKEDVVEKMCMGQNPMTVFITNFKHEVIINMKIKNKSFILLLLFFLSF